MSKCGATTEVYSRVVGYFRPVSNWNKGKKEEFKVSIHATRGGGDDIKACFVDTGLVSIHATRGGGDKERKAFKTKMEGFNPRHPWGWRQRATRYSSGEDCFNPRHPWGWRHVRRIQSIQIYRFNPRHPWGWRPYGDCEVIGALEVSIHATRGGGDSAPPFYRVVAEFQSTPPVGVATFGQEVIGTDQFVSIHATRGGGDGCFSSSHSPNAGFQSTPPVGVATILT